MIVLAGADLVLPEGIQHNATLVVDADRIADITGTAGAAASAPLHGHVIVPGFIDVHVHGLEGLDTLDGGGAVEAIAVRLPRFGVTAFCPTTVACAPGALRAVLETVQRLQARAGPGARVLPAHLESNFINPDYRGAQPLSCLRSPAGAAGGERASKSLRDPFSEDFHGGDIVAEIDRAGAAVGIVTLAPELDGALDLIHHLAEAGRRVSLGQSGATLQQARAAIEAGASQATHLFNRMPPLGHREPGLAGAILTSDLVAAELICDGVHVHPDMVRMAIRAKGPHRMMAITDGVAAAALRDGATAKLGGRDIHVRQSAAYLEDGTLAGSVATMDRVFRFLVREAGLSLTEAAAMCATTPAAELQLTDLGAIRKGAIADLVVLDRDLIVRQTYIGGRLAYSSQDFA
jgi:N-acetylglucosamine-6-phosphate deacetylase